MLPQPADCTTTADGPRRAAAAPGDRTRPSGRHRAQHGAHARRHTRPTGAHRQPGPRPIESWLLEGRHKQKALLASLVAAGLLMVMIPTHQGPADVDAVSAARRQAAGAAAAANGGSAVAPIASPAGRSAPKPRDAAPVAPADKAEPVTPTPTRKTPARPAPPASSGPPAVGAQDSTGRGAQPESSAVPTIRRGTGPARSLRRTNSAAVALTFDDGPDPVHTPRLLDLLKKNDTTATFCLVGVQVRAHPELVRRIVADGHALCNHSWDHSFTLGRQPVPQVRADLARTDAAIRAAVPDAKIPYFRAPGGNFTERLVTVAREFAMTSLYWEVDPRDWDRPDSESDSAHVDRIVTQLESEVRPGSIVLSHDFKQATTVDAYEILLPRLADRFTLGLP